MHNEADKLSRHSSRLGGLSRLIDSCADGQDRPSSGFFALIYIGFCAKCCLGGSAIGALIVSVCRFSETT
jgi:hypothetical protein